MRRILLTAIAGLASGIGSGLLDHAADPMNHQNELAEHAPMGGVGLGCGVLIAIAALQERKTR